MMNLHQMSITQTCLKAFKMITQRFLIAFFSLFMPTNASTNRQTYHSYIHLPLQIPIFLFFISCPTIQYFICNEFYWRSRGIFMLKFCCNSPRNPFVVSDGGRRKTICFTKLINDISHSSFHDFFFLINLNSV